MAAANESAAADVCLAGSGIYEIVNRNNGKRYVGSAKSFAKRFKNHRWCLGAGRHANRHLQASWVKHGAAAFEFSVLELCATERLIEREQAAIERLKPEFNICRTAGSTLGLPCSSETKQKIGAANIGRKMPPRTASYRATMSALHKGKAKTPEHMAALQMGRANQVIDDARKRRISDAVKRAYAEGRHSKERTPEHRAKIAATLSGRKATAEHRANQSVSQRGRKRGPYKLDPAKADARREHGKWLAAVSHAKRAARSTGDHHA